MNSLNILRIYQRLCDDAGKLKFSLPAEFVYNPLAYAWDGFRQYVKFSEGQKRVVFVGINPGPWGMAQTGIPFGEVNAVREFLGIERIKIFQPENTHVSYPVDGLECKRSEVSGKRLWGLFKEKFPLHKKAEGGKLFMQISPRSSSVSLPLSRISHAAALGAELHGVLCPLSAGSCS